MGSQIPPRWGHENQTGVIINQSKFPSQPAGLSRPAIATVGRILGRTAGYLTQIYLARLLAPQGFGLFAIGWTLLRLFSIAGHLGLDFGVIKFGSQYWQKDAGKLRSVVLISLGGAILSGLIFGSTLYGLASWLADSFFHKPDLEPILQCLAVAFPFATALRVMAAAGSLSGKMWGGALVEDIAQPILQLVLFIALFNTGTPLHIALLSTVLSYAISVIFGAVYVAWVIPGLFVFELPSWSETPSLLAYSLPAIIGVTLGAFNLWGDRLLVGYFGTQADTGIYQSISVITVFTTVLLSGFKIAAAPAIAGLHHDGNLAGIRTLAQSFTRWALLISCPVLLIVFINARMIIVTIFGTEYETGTAALMILTIGQFFYVGTGIVDQIFLMSGRHRQWLQISTLIFILTVVLDAILVPSQHLIGASLVSSIMMLSIGILSAITLKRQLQFWIFDGFHGKMILSVLLSGLVVYWLDISVVTVLDLMMTSALTFSLFGGFVILLGMQPDDRALLQRIFRK
jgi:O-antigen/teichoic acid export membrane protein